MHDLAAIAAPFYPSLDELGQFQEVAAEEMPLAYQILLAHDDHMTVTVEAFHDSLVDVRVLDDRDEGSFYTRASLLVTRSTGAVVQVGIMRINLGGLSDEVRREIESRRTPLGRILIRHNVLRRVELRRLYRIQPGPALREHLGLAADQTIYGRTARILVEERPAVELLEMVNA
jgi:chorismate-pyruvate lyase